MILLLLGNSGEVCSQSPLSDGQSKAGSHQPGGKPNQSRPLDNRVQATRAGGGVTLPQVTPDSLLEEIKDRIYRVEERISVLERADNKKSSSVKGGADRNWIGWVVIGTGALLSGWLIRRKFRTLSEQIAHLNSQRRVSEAGDAKAGRNKLKMGSPSDDGVKFVEEHGGFDSPKAETVAPSGEGAQETRRKSEGLLDMELVCRMYNAGVTNRDAQEEFRRQYRTIRFGVSNTQERRLSPERKALFHNAQDGDFYAVRKNAEGLFLVLPRFDLTLQEMNFGVGAIDAVYDCPNFDPEFRYRPVKVVRPALFRENAAQQSWELVERGELDLGNGERVR